MRYSIWIILILLVIFRFLTTRPIYTEGDKIRISSRVTTEPIRYTNSQRINLASLIIYLPRYPEVFYGDRVVIEGVVEDGKLKDPVLLDIKEGTELLYQFRKNLIELYQRAFPEPHSSLVAGVTLGSKASLPSGFWEDLKTTGTAHVVVASGMNVTLVAGFLMNLLILFIPRRRAVPYALVGIWGYSVISGFDAPIVRAAIMGSIGFSAQALGRVYDAWRGLFLSALGMLIIKPDWIGDLGFILSFVATFSLMLFERRIHNFLKRAPTIFREGLSTSLAAQIGVAPILFVSFGRFSLLSPVVNALVLWTVAPITILGMIAGILSFFIPLLSRLILFIAFPMTSWFLWIVDLFS